MNNKADKSNTCLKAEIDNRFTTSNLLINTLYNSSSVDLGDVYRLVKSVDHTTFSIEIFSHSSVSNSMVWMSLFSIEYNVDTVHCNLHVDNTYMFAKLNEELSIANYNESITAYVSISNVYTNTTTDSLL